MTKLVTKHSAFVISAAVCVTAAAAVAQSPARDQLARGNALWDQRLAKSAIAALEAATRDRSTAADAHEALGRIYTFKGWQQENAFPGWHADENLSAYQMTGKSQGSYARGRAAAPTSWDGRRSSRRTTPRQPRSWVKPSVYLNGSESHGDSPVRVS